MITKEEIAGKVRERGYLEVARGLTCAECPFGEECVGKEGDGGEEQCVNLLKDKCEREVNSGLRIYSFGSVKAPSAFLLYNNLPVEKVTADIEDWLKTKATQKRKGAAAALFRGETQEWGKFFTELMQMFCEDCDKRHLWKEYNITLDIKKKEDNSLFRFGELKDGDIFMREGEEWIKFNWKGFQAVKRSGGKEQRRMGDDEMVQFTGRNYGRQRTVELLIKGGRK